MDERQALASTFFFGLVSIEAGWFPGQAYKELVENDFIFQRQVVA